MIESRRRRGYACHKANEVGLHHLPARARLAAHQLTLQRMFWLVTILSFSAADILLSRSNNNGLCSCSTTVDAFTFSATRSTTSGRRRMIHSKWKHNGLDESSAWVLHAAPTKLQATNVAEEEDYNSRRVTLLDGPTPVTTKVCVALQNARPAPENAWQKLVELWNDPRPVTTSLAFNQAAVRTDIIGNAEAVTVGGVGTVTTSSDNSITTMNDIPYCIVSDEFDVALPSSEKQHDDELTKNTAKFQVLLYPRGRFVSNNNDNSNRRQGPAAAYLRYLPNKYGDEVDVACKLKLVDYSKGSGSSMNDNSNEGQSLLVRTAGGLPKSEDTWSAAMTFCHETEAVESVGRATDWGSSIWDSAAVCQALLQQQGDNNHNNSPPLQAEVEMTVFGARHGENTLDLSFNKGGLGAARRAVAESSSPCGSRNFRAGEVIVPLRLDAARNNGALDDKAQQGLRQLEESLIYPGIDFRIMTLRDGNNTDIFTTSTLSPDQRPHAKLALRPCGWKQQALWKKRDGHIFTDWPIEVEASLLANNTHTKCVSRFNTQSALPRMASAFTRDPIVMSAAVLLALLPLPIVLLVRNVVSLYVIPTASMEPTLLRGDVLLVEKFPHIQDRIQRGDVILFNPPPTLRDLINGGSRSSNGAMSSSGSAIGANSLFVKRLVGLPGDRNIHMDSATNEVSIDGQPVTGPDRTLCLDNNEPLKLIDKLLLTGKGKQLDQLESNEAYVLGDCKSVSVDSRVFGPLPIDNIAGKPLARIWPLNRVASGAGL
jgi:signal peptidase I